MIIPNDNLEREFDISIMSSLSTVQKDILVYKIVLNITDHPVTINRERISKISDFNGGSN